MMNLRMREHGDNYVPPSARIETDPELATRRMRAACFDWIADAVVGALPAVGGRVLELGSGPGHVADRLLHCTTASYVAIDPAPAMHALARLRLGKIASRVQFVEHDLHDPRWSDGLGQFDVVVAHQLLRRLRHKSYLTPLYARACRCLLPNGIFLMSDQVADEHVIECNDQLLSASAHRRAMLDVGFHRVVLLRHENGRALTQAA